MDVHAIFDIAIKVLVAGGLLAGVWAVITHKGPPLDPDNPDDRAW